MSEPPTEPAAVARAYYRAIDEGDYDLLADLLAPSFVQERPDRTLRGRDRFVRFMREERPLTETTHPIDALYTTSGGSADGTVEVAVRGRLLEVDGTVITGFVDVFSFEGNKADRLRTYTD